MRWRSSKPVHRPPGFVEPCLPTLGSAVPSGPKWAYEIKHDGFRFICRREGDQVRVFSRGGYDWTDRVPLIANALAALRVKSVTLDGEGVVCREDGVSDFDRLRAAVGRLGSRDAFLYAFDLLEINGTTCVPTNGRCDGPRSRAFCARSAEASGCPNTSMVRMAKRCSATHAPWVSKASSPSAATGPIARGGHRTGSK
jgi:hypothetical protein